jgi:hypothetical protein
MTQFVWSIDDAGSGGAIEQEWTDEIPHRPFRWYSGVVEAPILNEYTWRGASRRAMEYTALAAADVDRIASESPVAVFLMHTHGIADDYEYAFRLVDAMLAHISRRRYGVFTTLGDLSEAGDLAEAATGEGPDILAV